MDTDKRMFKGLFRKSWHDYVMEFSSRNLGKEKHEEDDKWYKNFLDDHEID